MQSMFKRVAGAIAACDPDVCTPEQIAFVAIAAMREPTDEMRLAYNKLGENYFDTTNYQLMIDSILKECVP